MAKRERPLSWGQQDCMKRLRDGQYHSVCGWPVTASGIRGLISRGLIEKLDDPNETVWTWVKSGKYRLKESEGV